jgi:hypothetical protein
MVSNPPSKPSVASDEDAIKLDHDYEVAYWATVLGVSVVQLRAAVERAGPILGAVKRELARQAR